MGRIVTRAVCLTAIASALLFWGCENPILSVVKTQVAKAAGNPDIQVSRGAVVVPSGGSSNAGSSMVGTSAKVISFTVQNVGKSALQLTGTPIVALGGADLASYSLGTLPFVTINAGQNSTFTLEFAPISLGGKTITVSIPSDDPDTPTYSITVTGQGVAAPGPDIRILRGTTDIDLVHTFDFGGIPVGSTANVGFEIWNVGTAGSSLGLSASAISITGGDSAQFPVGAQNAATQVAEGGFTTFMLKFAPTAGGTFTATAHVANNDPDGVEGPDYPITITGTGELPDIAVTQGATILADGAGSYPFAADVYADGDNGRASAEIVFTITNPGNVPLNISGISLSAGHTGDFDITGPAQSSVGAGGSTTFTVRFDPTSTGSRAATVSISSNVQGAKNPYTFNVTGSSSFAPKVYWTNRDTRTIMRANLDGSNVELLLSTTGYPVGIAIDQVNHKMYWAEITGAPLGIYCANLDGTSKTLVYSTPFPIGVAVDPANSKLYWSSFDLTSIGMMNVSGTSPTTFTVGYPVIGIAVDPNSDNLYWSNFTSPPSIMQGSKTSLSAGTTFAWGMSPTYGVALDLTNNLIYWVEQDGAICSSDLGSPGRNVVGNDPQLPLSIAVDPVGGWIFYGDWYTSMVFRAIPYGGVDAVMSGSGGRIYGIALDLVP